MMLQRPIASVSNAVEIMRANGGIVEDVVALVDRHEGAEDKLKKMGVKLKRGDRDQRHRKRAVQGRT